MSIQQVASSSLSSSCGEIRRPAVKSSARFSTTPRSSLLGDMKTCKSISSDGRTEAVGGWDSGYPWSSRWSPMVARAMSSIAPSLGCVIGWTDWLAQFIRASGPLSTLVIDLQQPNRGQDALQEPAWIGRSLTQWPSGRENACLLRPFRRRGEWVKGGNAQRIEVVQVSGCHSQRMHLGRGGDHRVNDQRVGAPMLDARPLAEDIRIH